MYLCVYILYTSSCYRTYIYIHMGCRLVLVKLHPITVHRPGLGECAVPVLNVTCCFLFFTICVLLCDNKTYTMMLVAYSAPSHYLDQCWIVVNWNIRNNLQWKLIKVQKFSFTKMHLKISPTKRRPLCPGSDELRKGLSVKMVSGISNAFSSSFNDHWYNSIHTATKEETFLKFWTLIFFWIYKSPENNRPHLGLFHCHLKNHLM